MGLLSVLLLFLSNNGSEPAPGRSDNNDGGGSQGNQVRALVQRKESLRLLLTRPHEVDGSEGGEEDVGQVGAAGDAEGDVHEGMASRQAEDDEGRQRQRRTGGPHERGVQADSGAHLRNTKQQVCQREARAGGLDAADRPNLRSCTINIYSTVHCTVFHTLLTEYTWIDCDPTTVHTKDKADVAI